MPQACIAEAGLAHAEVISALHHLSFDEPWSAFTVRQVLAMPGAFGLLAVPRGAGTTGDADVAAHLQGFALSRRAADECELLSLAVGPVHRGHGVGRLLLEAVIGRARALSVTSLFLEVAEDNDVARTLYRSVGFHPIGRRPGYYRRASGPPMAALTLALPLSR